MALTQQIMLYVSNMSTVVRHLFIYLFTLLIIETYLNQGITLAATLKPKNFESQVKVKLMIKHHVYLCNLYILSNNRIDNND